MKPVVVADTGPLIALAKLQLLSLLTSIFSHVYVPEQVLFEATRQCERDDAQAILSFISRHSVRLENTENDWVLSLRLHLDEGEIQAIYHAKELSCGVLMDEKRGRKIASQYAIPVIGVLGILIEAKAQGLIDSVKPYLQKLIKYEYRLSKPLMVEALRLAGE